MSDRNVRWLTVALLALLGSYCIARLEFTNSITHFIPSRAEAELVALSLELVESPLTRRMVLSIEGGPESARVASGLADALRTHPEVAWLETAELDEAALRSIYDLYFERRLYLASDHPETEIPALLSPHALDARAVQLRRRLAQPDAMIFSRTAGADPLGLFERILNRIQAFQPTSATSRSEQTEYAVLMLGLRSSPFDSQRQSQLLGDIEVEFQRLAANYPTALRLDQNGANRFAVATERSIRGDVNLISAVSISVICGLFLLVFHSLRQLLIAALVPLGGFTFAMAVAASFNEPVHGITLGFGFVLIGVAIDYPIHLMNHYALSEADTTPRETRNRIRNSLLLSGLTTTLAFSSLAVSDFPGLSEMGRFGATGIPLALGLTILCLPAFLSRPKPATPVQRALSSGSARLIEWLSKRRKTAIAILMGFAAIAAAGMPRLHWEDDPATLMSVDPALFAESERVRRRVTDFDGGRFVVGLASDSEAALALNARIDERLRAVVAAGELDGVGSLHTFIWPERLQRANLAAFRATPNLGDRIERAFSRSGFRSGAFAAFEAAVVEPSLPPLRIEDLAASPLARVLDSLVELEGRWAVVTYLRGVHSGSAISSALDGLEGVHYVDQKEIISNLYEGYRRSTTRMVILGSFIVLVVLLLRYRNFSRTLLAFLPAALGAASTLGLFGLLGVEVNVASAVSLLVVLGMGVDYGIFAVDSTDRAGSQGATLSSLLVSCVTSVSVFGILALSEQPVLRAIGLTTGVGVMLALTLSPIALALARPREPR
jgi:predicted exporter